MTALYLGLLFAGVTLFALSLVAQWLIVRWLRRDHPRQWQIIAAPEGGNATHLQVWTRLQRALRSPILPALRDPRITAWRQVWRFGPWLGWLCWAAALSMRLLLH
jgi:hypothetical protein